MRISGKYSHLNGEEFLIVHKKQLYDEILHVIKSVDAEQFKTKVSNERGMVGREFYSPTDLNNEFKRLFRECEWEEERRSFYVSSDYNTVKILEVMDFEAQKRYIRENHLDLLKSYNQTDFVKEKVAIEVQMGKYFAVTYDLFVKHLSFYTVGKIDVGIEIVPSKGMTREMSSGVPFFEKEVHNVLRHGRTTPPVPIIIIGVEP